jgi:hypothetical protein
VLKPALSLVKSKNIIVKITIVVSMGTTQLIVQQTANRSKKNASSASNISSKVFSPSVLSENTEISKTSEKSNTHDFYPKNLNHAFMPKSDFGDCCAIKCKW